jgi:hypothetical protein
LRQVELASKSDELYNKLNNNAVQKDIHPPAVKSQIDNNLDQSIDLSQHAYEEKFPKDDIIILQPKNSLELPLLQNRRFPVTNDDVKNFCSIVELAYTKGVQKYVNPSSSYYICCFSLVWFILFLLCSIKSFLLVCLFVVFTGFFVRSYCVKFFKVYCSFISLGQSL